MNADELSAVCNQFNLDYWGCPAEWGIPACPERAVFCSQSLNLRAIRLIGYDMDYTLIHYKVKEWEGRAYFYAKENLLQVCPWRPLAPALRAASDALVASALSLPSSSAPWPCPNR